MERNVIDDRKLSQLSLIPTVVLGLVFLLLLLISYEKIIDYYPFTFISIPGLVVLFGKGLFINKPNEAIIVEFLGYYIGTYFKPGVFITIPFANKHVISLKFQNINTERIKVNDANGNPIEISAVIVWRVNSPAKAYYGVDHYKEFMSIQSESAIRELASSYPYDSEGENESLRKSSDKIISKLQSMLQNRLEIAGIEVLEARISYLAYSSEIAQVMLKRQQAHAITSARKHIVQNSITIVEEVISHFETNKDIQLDGKQKVQLINNLLVALISEQDAQPTLSLNN